MAKTLTPYGYKKRWITPEGRKKLREHGVSSLAVSDYEKTDPGLRNRAAIAGGEGSRTSRDCVKVGKRARELMAEAAAAAPAPLPKRRSLAKWSLDALLEPSAAVEEAPRVSRGSFRDLDHGDEVDETPDLLEMMTFEPDLDDRDTPDLDEILDREQEGIEAALAGWVPERK